MNPYRVDVGVDRFFCRACQTALPYGADPAVCTECLRRAGVVRRAFGAAGPGLPRAGRLLMSALLFAVGVAAGASALAPRLARNAAAEAMSAAAPSHRSEPGRGFSEPSPSPVDLVEPTLDDGEPAERACGSDRQSTAPALSALGAASHDPHDLLARAEDRRARGAAITILRTVFASTAAIEPLVEATAQGLRVTPERRHGIMTGLRFDRIPAESLLGIVGLLPGDLVTAANGYSMLDPRAALDAYESAACARMVVVEARRGESLLVLAISWS